jgi:putative SOS response-associated peptidase YedK
MCGRATLSTPSDELRDIFALDDLPELPPRFNIAPTQPIAVIREPHHLELLRWGLVLPGAQRRGAQGINVRVESVARAPAYRESFRKRRCLVIVTGFFEWRRRDRAK